MKKLSTLALSLLVTFALYSCGEENIEPEIGNQEELPTEFSENSVEENKAALEDNGIEMIQEMEALKETEAANVALHLESLLNAASSEEWNGSVAGKMVNSLAGLRTGKASATDLFKVMMDPMPDSAVESPKAFFDVYGGTYNWNSSLQDWDFTAGGSNLEFLFPSSETSTTNDAKIFLGNYSGIQSTASADYTGDVPTNLEMYMSIGSNKLMTYNFAASYNGNGEPSSVETALVIAPFTIAAKLKNTTSEVGMEYSLKHGDKILVAVGADADGSFSTDTAENATDVSEVVTDAGAYFQLLNIKIAGTVDVEGLSAEYNGADSLSMEQETELYNKYYELVVYYADSKQKIADTEFFVNTFTETYGWYDEYGNYQTYSYESKEVEMRLVFADGSKADFETYFGEGFEAFNTELEGFYNSLN